MAANARLFTRASSEYISFDIGAFGNMPTAWTMACLLKQTDDSTDSCITPHVNGTAASQGFGTSSSSTATQIEHHHSGGASTLATINSKVADGWHVFAVTKTAGTTAPRFHKYVRATDVWQHVALGGTLANLAAYTAPKLELGRLMWTGGTFVDYADCTIQIAGWLSGTALGDTAIEVLEFGLPAWLGTMTTACVCLNQASVATTIPDLTGNGSNESARTGTTVVAGDPAFEDTPAPIVTQGGTLGDATDAATYTSSSFTPVLDDLLVGMFAVSGSTATDWAPSDSLGGSWSKVFRAIKNTSADFVEVWVRDTLAAASALTVTFSHAGANATGCGITVARVSGMTRTGTAAVRQYEFDDNEAPSTPANTLPDSARSNNPVISGTFISTSGAATTLPTGWTGFTNAAWATPVNTLRTCFRNSGFVGPTLTWGSATITAMCDFLLELEAGSTPSPRFAPVPLMR